MKQTRKIGVAGGFINQMMGNNQTIPKVGEGATELMYSDRHAWEVISTNEDGSECRLQRYAPKRSDKLGMSDCQAYEYKELTESKMSLVWRKKGGGKWCQHSKEVRFIPKFLKELESKSSKHFYGDQLKEVYGQEVYDSVYFVKEDDYRLGMNIVEGITKEYDNYHPISIIFGVKQEYYDFSF